MKLLPNEKKIIALNEGKIILTNHRIQMNGTSWGQLYSIIIFLENISSIEVKHKSNFLYFILGLFFIIGFYFINNNHIYALLALGVMCIALFWLTLQEVVSISSNGGSSINFIVTDIDDDEISDFIHQVSIAKQKRVRQLNND